MADEDFLANPPENKVGDQVVDLTQVWPTARSVTGYTSHWVTPPTEPTVQNDGNGGYYIEDDGKRLPTNAEGERLPPKDIDPVTHEPLDPTAPGVQTNFRVDIGHLHSVENTLLLKTSTAIDEFETFKNARVENETWIFFTGTPGEYNHPNNHSPSFNNWTGAPAGTIKADKDPHPEQTAELIETQNALLQAIGGVIHLVGVLAGKFNDAAQIYAGADRGSWID